MKSPIQKLNGLDRRSFVEKTAKSMLGLSLVSSLGRGNAIAQASAAGGGTATSCIFLYMGGGMTHIDTFDPKSGETAGPTNAINTNADGVQIANHLPQLARHADKYAIIRSMSSTTGVHQNGNYLMHTGYRPRATITHPSLGPFAQQLLGRGNTTLPDSVVIGGGGGHPGAGFLPAALKPVPLNNAEAGLRNINATVPDATFDRRIELSNEFDSGFRERFQHRDVTAYSDLYDEALSLMKSEELDAFDLNKEPGAVRDRYGRNGFGQGVLLARRLVQNNVRFVEVNLGGWDMHNYIEDAVTSRANTLDTAVSALLEDLDAQGLLDSTIIAIGSEFGRTPRINENQGRDHHPRAFSTFLAGGGIRGGQVHGATDAKGYAVTDKQASIQDFLATIGHGLGINTEQRIFSPSGRPFTVGDKGKPITELFG